MASSRFAIRYLLIPLTAAAGLWSVATLRFQTELLPLFPPDLPAVKALASAQQAVVSSRQVIAVAAPGSSVDWSDLGAVAEQLRGLPGIGAVQVGMGPEGAGAARMAAERIAALPADRFAAVQQAFSPTEAARRLRETRQEMAGAVDQTGMMQLRLDPLRVQDLLFAPGEPNPLESALSASPILTVEAAAPLKNFEESQRFVDGVRQALAAATASFSPHPHFLLTGPPAFTAEISRQMRHDVLVMVAFALGLTLLTFWTVYRSLAPLLSILMVQVLAALAALTAARLVFGELNVVSLGFASILPGLGMDYSILVYHHYARRGDEAAWRNLRRTIWFCAGTAAGSFGVLYFSSFPGLRQLAVLVGAGLLATAFFATTLLAGRLARRPPRVPDWIDPASEALGNRVARHRVGLRLIALGTVLLALLLLPDLSHYLFYDPGVERLQPTQLEAYRGEALLQHELTALTPPPTGIDPETNRPRWTPVDRGALAAAFHAAGFGDAWAQPALQAVDLLNDWHAGKGTLGAASDSDGGAGGAWTALRGELNRTAVDDFKRLSLINLLGVIVLCAVAHRSFRLVTLNLAALGLALLFLAGLLYADHASMTMVSLLSIPLLIGLTVSYSLYVLLGVEKAEGALGKAFRPVAVPIGLTGICSVVGFTAPTLTHQPVLQNFGLVMDFGIVAAVTSGLILAPALYWRCRTTHHASFYQEGSFVLAARLARALPLGLTRAIAGTAGALYAWTHPAHVAVVHRNVQLLRAGAPRATARRVYSEFSKTLADYFHIGTRSPEEASKIIAERAGIEFLREVAAAGKGGLLVTAHHGLFELGGLVMSQFGFRTSVLTLAEPCRKLTEWRTAFRQGWGVETIEVGTDSFAFLEVAERLRRGGFVAALIDRPNPHYNVPVMLPSGTAGFSAAVLLLALQCGAPVIPATMARRADGKYRAEVFAPIRMELRGTREETLRFYTQQIADILLPTLCRYPEQWYQFVPLSSESASA